MDRMVDSDSPDNTYQTPTIGDGVLEPGIELLGTVLGGRFEVRGVLGSGGMGTVLRVWDRRLEREVALKLLSRSGGTSGERFVREAKLQASIDHPNVCSVFDAGEVDGRPYVAMRLIDGPTLRSASATLPLEEQVRAVRAAAEGAHAAHRAGLVHRDIKPSNILLEPTGGGRWHAFLLDFGLARAIAGSDLTRTGVAIGTPQYMAPEQVAGNAGTVDRRTDVYSLGAALYTVLSGSPPFVADTEAAILMKVLRTEPRPLSAVAPEVPADLAAIVLKCLEKTPGRRYQSARELADDLGRWLDGEPVWARPPGRWDRLRKLARRHRAVATATALLVPALLVVTGLWIAEAVTARRTAAVARRLGQEVAAVSSILDVAYLRPVHDIRDEQAQIRERMDMIEKVAERGGDAVDAMSAYALGRGHLALGELEEARESLDRAWKLGFTEPENALALGRTLAELYRDGLERIDALPAGEERDRRRAALERELRDPAVRYLQRTRSSGPGEAARISGLISALEGRLDEALDAAERALELVPLDPDTYQLKGDILTARADAAVGEGRWGIAENADREAIAAYEHAAGITRSNPDLYRSQCAAWTALADVLTSVGRDPATAFGNGMVACETAAAIDPESAETATKLARLEHDRALTLRRAERGQALDAAVDAAENATALDPDDVSAYYWLGSAHLARGEMIVAEGRDPSSALTAAADAARRALELDPGHTGAADVLAGTERVLAGWKRQHDEGRGTEPEAEGASARVRPTAATTLQIRTGILVGPACHAPDDQRSAAASRAAFASQTTL